MQCWSQVLEANKSYSVYSGHITMLQSCKPLNISARSRSRTLHPSSLIYHYPENLMDKIHCQACFLLQHLGTNNMEQLIQPYVSSSTEWCPQDRSQKFFWAILLVPTETFCCEHITSKLKEKRFVECPQCAPNKRTDTTKLQLLIPAGVKEKLGSTNE